MFFFLAQTEQGDIFKITLETEDDMVRAVVSVFVSIFNPIFVTKKA